MFRINSLLLVFLLLIPAAAWAQVGLSPYGVKGIGLLHDGALTRNRAMGGLGIGNSHYLYLNSMNPAQLTRNNFYTTVEAAFSIENTRFASTEQQDQGGSGGLDYLGIALPLKYDRLTLNLGIQPYSVVNYAIQTSEPIQGTNNTAQLTFEGEGGISQAHVAAGLKLTKTLSLGGRVAYLFGDISRITSSVILNDSISFGQYSSPRFTERTSFSDLTYTLGLSYRKQLSESNDTWLMAGAMYDFGTELSAERFLKRERYLLTYGEGGSLDSEALQYLDTVIVDQAGSYRLPQGFGLGLSYEKMYSYAFGADVSIKNWNDYQGFEGGNDGLKQSMRVALGGEWTPDANSTKPGTYYQRMTYRLGLHYEKTPYEFNQEPINDFGINFGLNFPVANASSIQTTFSLGQRGKTDNELIRERYFRLSLGITFNDRWFTKVKYD